MKKTATSILTHANIISLPESWKNAIGLAKDKSVALKNHLKRIRKEK